MSYHLEKTIVLVGLMGAGKSSVGRRLAKRLKLPFVDIDEAIESEQKYTVTEIFEKVGEEKFRQFERNKIASELEKEPHIIATGGGAFINDETRALIKEKAISIWLKPDFEVLVERVSRKKTRPLLEKGDKAEIMKKLMDERYPIYEQADFMIKSNEGPHNQVVEDIIKKLKINK